MMQTIVMNGEKATPSKIVCIGRNYVAHAQELGNAVPAEPVIFIKPNSAISPELKAGLDEEHHYEGELCFLVSEKQLKGVGFGLDITRRQTQQNLKEKGLPWERAKAFDGSAVFSEFITLDDITLGDIDVGQLGITLHINDQLKQQGDVSLMLFKPQHILESIQQFLTLEDDDIIMTGTPAGVGPIESGDTFTGAVHYGGETVLKVQWQAS